MKETLKLYEMKDGEQHYMLARNNPEARRLYLQHFGEMFSGTCREMRNDEELELVQETKHGERRYVYTVERWLTLRKRPKLLCSSVYYYSSRVVYFSKRRGEGAGRMRRYILFMGLDYYPSGGWRDYEHAADTIGELEAIVSNKYDPPCEWWHIFDTREWRIVKDSREDQQNDEQE